MAETKTGEETQDWVSNKKRYAERIRVAKVELAAEAKAAAEAKLKAAVKRRFVILPVAHFCSLRILLDHYHA